MSKAKYNPYIVIAERIKKVRLDKKIKKTEFAKKIGVQTSDIDSIEAGNTKISLDMLFMISNALGTEMNYLLTGISNERILFASNMLDRYIETFKFIESLTQKQKQVFTKVLDQLPSLYFEKSSKK